MFELFGSLRRADDNEYLAGGVHDVRVEGAELVDVQDAGDLGHESFDEAEVAADDPDDRRDGLDVVLVARRRGAARVRASSSPSRSASRRIQRLVLVGEADPAVQLGVAGSCLSMPGMPIRVIPRSRRSKKSRSCSRPAVRSQSASSTMTISVL